MATHIDKKDEWVLGPEDTPFFTSEVSASVCWVSGHQWTPLTDPVGSLGYRAQRVHYLYAWSVATLFSRLTTSLHSPLATNPLTTLTPPFTRRLL